MEPHTDTLEHVLIRHGHVESAAHLSDVMDLETFVAANEGEDVSLSNDVDLEQVKAQLPKLKTILVNFPSYADGRGFSIARQLRKTYGFKGTIIADGPLIPDQYSMALQCGFDAVRLDGKTFSIQAESDWFNAMDAFAGAYQRGYTVKNGPATSIFDARKTSAAALKQAAQGGIDPYFGLSAHKAIERALDEYNGKLALVSSLGVDSVVLLHMVSKRYQTPERANMPILEQIGKQAKINPLAYWHAKDVTAYIQKHDLPPHPMLALGFLSIGCQPCTTRVAEGEDPRAGRWRHHDKTECGIHYIDGKWVPIEDKKTFEVF